MNDFAPILAALDSILIPAIEQALAAGLVAGAGQLQGIAQASGTYEDDTGATRSGTVAYAATPEIDGSAAFGAALAAVEQHNPGTGQSVGTGESVDENTYAVVLTVPSDYIDKLEIEHAGARAFLGPAMQQNAPQITAAVAAAVGGALA